MTLLISVVAAIVTTLVWYTNEKARKLNIGKLAFAFWGASLMWMVDAVVEYLEDGADYFVPSGADMINDAFLGICVVVLALAVWVVYFIIKDPDKVIYSAVKTDAQV